MDASEVPTIRQILEDASVEDYLEPEVYATLVAALEQRESIMITNMVETAQEHMDRQFQRKLDRIINMM